MKNNNKKISLAPFEETFITDEYVSWLNNKTLMQFSEHRHKEHTLNSCYEYFNSFQNSENVLYAVLDKNSGVHVGNINAYIDKYNSIADIGILIGKPGQGYGLKAWNEMIYFLLNEEGVRKITAATMSVNELMIRIFEKSGMVYEYTKKDQVIYKAKPVDLIGYCKFNMNPN